MVSRETKQDFIGMNKKILLLFFLSTLFSQQSILLDEIAAVVDDEVVLLSDVVLAANALAAEENVDPFTNPSKYKELLLKSSESMIEQLVIIRMAEIDSVTVLEKDVDRALERQIQNIISQSGSEEAAEQVLGRKISDFKRSYKDDMEGKLIAEKYTGDLTRSIEITRPEVEDFFKTYKDSIPPFPTTVKLRHLLIKPSPSEDQVEKTLSLLKQLRQNVLDKKNTFEELAAQYTQDPGSKNTGGSLGFVRRGTLVSPFEAAAFTLQPGEISMPVKTEFGYHIIETEEIRGDRIKVRHILMSPPITEQDESIAYNRALVLKDSSQTISEFISTTKAHSMDDQTSDGGGSLGWIDPNKYPVPEFGMVLGQINPNECAGPVRSELGYHLLWVEASRPGGSPDIDKHWSQIENIALNKKKGDWFKGWVVSSRENFFIHINN